VVLEAVQRNTYLCIPTEEDVKMKITDKRLRSIIREEVSKILEYEQYVDEDGNVYDDEGNVSHRGSSFGRRYGGQTYTGTRSPWSGREDRFKRRRDSLGQTEEPRKSRIGAVKAALEVEENKFLRSILQQLEAGRTLSAKQKTIVKKIMTKIAKDAGMDATQAIKLFERKTKVRNSKRRMK